MAVHYSLKPFLLFLILLTILSFPSISATTSSSSVLSSQELDAVIQGILCPSSYEALLCQGSDFTTWANLLSALKTTLVLPINSTMFVPTDAAISNLHYADSYLIHSHVTPKRHLLFSDLYHLKPLSLLPTLVPSKTILITSTLPSSYKVDNAIITHPDLYVSSHIVVHGINHILDTHPERSSMPPLLYAGNVLAPTSSKMAPVAAPVARGIEQESLGI